jgi:CRP/FNR family cyclic AMP-dependent transcriptional regulator
MSIDYFERFEEEVSFKAGEVIFEAGESADKMYGVREGEVELVFRGHLLETCTKGQFFGEMALIDGSERAATARARTDVTLVPINRQRFLFLVQETPTFAVQAMTRLAERIRQYTRNLPEAG